MAAKTAFKSLPILPLVFLFFLSGCGPASEPHTSATTSTPPKVAASQKSIIQIDATDYVANCDKALAEAKKKFQILITMDSPSSMQLLDGLNDLEILLEKTLYHSGLVAYVFPEESLREAGEACEQKMAAFISEVNLSRSLYDRILNIDEADLNELDKRYRDKTLEHFVLSGVALDENTRTKIKTLQDEIVKIGQEFDRNIRDAENFLVVDSEEDLAGLPQDYIDRHKPDADGKIRISTKSTNYAPFMQYAKSDRLRKEFYLLYNQRAFPHNTDVLKNLLTKRFELANLLGFSNYAALITSDKMIESPEKAQEFIDKVASLATPKANQDLSALLKELKKAEPHAQQVQDWQKSYLTEQIKVEQFNVNTQEIRQYFRYGKVRDGIFNFIEDLFDVQIKPWKTPVWHDSVESFELWSGDEIIGRFYLDMHPRSGKYSHAAQFSLVNGIKNEQITEAALVCNFPGENNPDALMEFSEVETFLHEFGHLIHTLFAGQNQNRIAFSGIKTEWDFVEAPSQMLEEWVWDKKTLQSFAINKEGQTIPDELIEKMKHAKNFGQGIHTKQQLFYAALSLQLHNQDPKNIDPLKLTQRLQEKYSSFPYVEGAHFYNGFGHLNGYSAIYYTYMWSLVIATDMHSEFVVNGLRNKSLANRFRTEVLAPGGQKDAKELVKSFLQRDYTFDAFAKKLMED